MDIKANIEYWDIIDNTLVDAVRAIAGMSVVPISKETLDEHELGVAAEAREVVIEYLESIGCSFPIVDENVTEGRI